MVIKVHDILKINSIDELVFLTKKPLWTDQTIKNNPYVIVRRAEIKKGLIPIGIRGNERHKRVSAYILQYAIKEVYSPERLTKRINEISQPILIREALQKIKKIMEELNLKWGVFGSVAYEIVTKESVITEKSDLDIIIYNGVPKENLTILKHQLNNLPIQVDILIETSFGGYNLNEYISKTASKILIKTNHGPKLVEKNKIFL